MVFEIDSSLHIIPEKCGDRMYKMAVPGGKTFLFEQTSIAAPVQFDVFDKNGEQCGYVRYRGEKFTVDVVNGNISQTIFTLKDSWLDECPNEFFMNVAARVLDAYSAFMYY